MHYLYYVSLPKDSAETPREAMNKAQAVLDENGFAGSGGYFSNAKADWYEVGGRWASHLCYSHKWAQEASEEIEKFLAEEAKKDGIEEPLLLVGVHYGEGEKQKRQGELNAQAELIWGKHRPKDYPKVRFNRHTDSEGKNTWGVPADQLEDCAVLVTPELYEYVTKRNDERDADEYFPEVFLADECNEVTMKDTPELREKLIGNWLVVIDYHN